MTSPADTTASAVHPTVLFFDDLLEHLFTDPDRVLVQRGPGYGLATTFAPSPDLNLVYLDGPGPDGEGVKSVLARVRELQVPFLCAVTPGGVAHGVPGLLEDEGVPQLMEMPFMTLAFERLRLQDATVPGLEIRHVRTEHDWQAWGSVAADAFGFSPVMVDMTEAALRGVALNSDSRARFYLGILDGEPAGTALAVLGQQEVGVWCVGTAPAARRRGVGAAMTTAPLLDARDGGYIRARLGATPMGYPVYERLGWQVEHQSPFYLVQPAGEGTPHGT
ncbi:GNAT family N-acetyltransferase [Deinococcus navajonensis]|uniref:GNAT family N-acetyltransferase n=1 Tax=Deinococcus navajonensis TaxID=309884 RepID=A0ABV8XJS1_9DEIO